MPDKQVSVTFQPSGRQVYVLAGSKMLEAAARAGLTVDTPCGGQGTCGKCRVHVTTSPCEPTEAEQRVYSAAELADGWRLACQTSLCGKSVVVNVPPESLFGGQHQILANAHKQDIEVLPAVCKKYVELAQPTLEDNVADLMRLERSVGAVKTDLHVLRRLPHVLRENGFKGTAVISNHHLIDFEAGDTSDHCYGAALDIGTTTLVCSLLDLADGNELGIVSRMNPQVKFGDDVLSRIQASGSCTDCLNKLRDVLVKEIADMIREVCKEAKIRCEHIYEVAFSGNTTMEHLLCGVDVTQLGQVPFVPAYERGLVLSAGELKLPINPSGLAYVFPVIGGFVGGDTVAGILATKIASMTPPVMMVDIGTNGEIMLANDDKLWATSTAAGPAFEGARISCGMRATTGAIEKVVTDGDLRFSVIGDVEPAGLCGSGLIDLAAELLTAGVITPEGRLLPAGELPDSVPQPLRKRVIENDGKAEFLLAGKGKKRVTLTERDVRELQLATGAIRAGIKILLKQAGLETKDLKRVLIAGGFGSFIRRSNAQRIGLLPGDVDRQNIKYVGNASLNGARWALLSTDARKKAEQLARQATHVELSQDMNFQMEFAEAMIFPS